MAHWFSSRRYFTDVHRLPGTEQTDSQEQISHTAHRREMEQLREATVFPKLDLWSGYWQTKLVDNLIHKMAFHNRYGSYGYLVMPFGLCNAPAMFQVEMNHIPRAMLDECVVVCLDDILIYSKNMKEHMEHTDRTDYSASTHPTGSRQRLRGGSRR
ncbi:unnamed protein product [Closterium sp. Yama58-4]|nr:unnamed protein product [Closterium sp. Yama58-4]